MFVGMLYTFRFGSRCRSDALLVSAASSAFRPNKGRVVGRGRGWRGRAEDSRRGEKRRTDKPVTMVGAV